MNPNIRPPNIHTVKTAPIPSPNRHIIGLAIRAICHDKVEHRRIHQNQIMNREIRRLFNTQQPRTISLPIPMVFIPIAYTASVSDHHTQIHTCIFIHV